MRPVEIALSYTNRDVPRRLLRLRRRSRIETRADQRDDFIWAGRQHGAWNS
jgi:hypothetical protein